MSASGRPAIETENLTKRFHRTVAVDGLNLVVPAGSVFGFLGPNGAGKTTTIRLLMGLARPTSGQARLFGEPVGPDSPAKRYVGFLPDVPAFYGWMTAREYLDLAGRLFGLDRRTIKRRTEELLDLTGLKGAKIRIGGYSRGMKQRLGLAQALINDPDLVILDEPTSALDPIGRHEVLETIKAMAAGVGGPGRAAVPKTVFFSTHILADIERVADRVAILDEGRLLVEDTMAALKARYARPVFEVRVESGLAELARAVAAEEWAQKVETQEGPAGVGVGKGAGQLRILAKDGAKAKLALPRLVANLGLALDRFEVAEPTLEDIFLNLVGENGRPDGAGGASPARGPAAEGTSAAVDTSAATGSRPTEGGGRP